MCCFPFTLATTTDVTAPNTYCFFRFRCRGKGIDNFSCHAYLHNRLRLIFTYSLIPSSMITILLSVTPFEVSYMIVGFIFIFVVYFYIVMRVRQKCFCNKSMNSKSCKLSIFA